MLTPLRCADQLLVASGHRHPGNRDDFVAAHDERPRVALRARHLCVHEQILHLLARAREAVARTPRAHVETLKVGLDRPGTPTNAAAERNRALLEPEPLVLPYRLEA